MYTYLKCVFGVLRIAPVVRHGRRTAAAASYVSPEPHSRLTMPSRRTTRAAAAVPATGARANAPAAGRAGKRGSVPPADAPTSGAAAPRTSKRRRVQKGSRAGRSGRAKARAAAVAEESRLESLVFGLGPAAGAAESGTSAVDGDADVSSEALGAATDGNNGSDGESGADGADQAGTGAGAGAGAGAAPSDGAAWADPDDEAVAVNVAKVGRLRKLRDSHADTVISGGEYSARLRKQYVPVGEGPVARHRADQRVTRGVPCACGGGIDCPQVQQAAPVGRILVGHRPWCV